MTADLRHLHCFLAIADEGSITRAAATLHLTQPALSRTLRQLEDHLGVRLVDRSTHHLQLTAAGIEFRERAAAAVAAVAEVLDPANLGPRALRVGYAWAAFGDHTPVLLRRWNELKPRTPLLLLRIDDRMAGLGRGEVDVAILRDPGPLPGLHCQLLTAERRLAAVGIDSPFAGRESVRLEELSDQTIAVNTVSGTTTVSLWPADGQPRAVVEVGNTDDWLLAIASGAAVGVTAASTAELHRYPGVIYLPLADSPDIEVWLAWTDPASHPEVAALVELASEVVGRRP